MFKLFIKDMDSFEINKIIASILLTALDYHRYWQNSRYPFLCRET